MTPLTSEENQAILLAIRYWIEKWDWECPTLFGVEKSDMELIEKGWPETLTINKELAATVCLSSLREILVGASALDKLKVPLILGISFEHAAQLSVAFSSELRNAL